MACPMQLGISWVSADIKAPCPAADSPADGPLAHDAGDRLADRAIEHGTLGNEGELMGLLDKRIALVAYG